MKKNPLPHPFHLQGRPRGPRPHLRLGQRAWAGWLGWLGGGRGGLDGPESLALGCIGISGGEHRSWESLNVKRVSAGMGGTKEGQNHHLWAEVLSPTKNTFPQWVVGWDKQCGAIYF